MGEAIGDDLGSGLHNPVAEAGILIHELSEPGRIETDQLGPVDAERQFKDWAIAYAQSEQQLALDEIADFKGREALALFRQLLPNLDYC